MQQCEAVVVGAGFGGMGAAIQLGRSGIDDVLILEREHDLGGTWHVNHYPGLAVDIASVTYSYSFAPNPYWSRLFAPGPELKRYAEHVADTYGLRPKMRFGQTVDGAVWDETEQRWTVSIANGEPISTRFLITATGFLSQPKTPDIPGIETFAGAVVHTADWDDELDLRGRRAAVIGTGATAVQLIPQIAPLLEHLTVYQRTPIWVTPKQDFDIPAPVQQLFRRVPLTQRAARLANTSMLELVMVTGVLHFKQASLLNRSAAAIAKAHLFRQVRDPDLRRKLTPDYDFGCKRPTFSNDYFPTFTRPNVDLETDPIQRIEPDAIVTRGGHRAQIDTLVLATGFDLWEVNFPAIEVIGRGGRSLGTWWREGRFQAYEGVSVPRFPNFLTLASPYSYSGLSYFTTIETQMAHMGRLFAELDRRGASTFEVTRQANDTYLDEMTERVGDSVFARGSCATARSYYFNPHGEAAILRPTSTLSAVRAAHRFPLTDYTYA